MFRDIFFAEQLRGSTLTLVDTDPEGLARMTELARLLNETSSAGMIIEHTIERRAALEGAGFVLNATAIERNRLWDAPVLHRISFILFGLHGLAAIAIVAWTPLQVGWKGLIVASSIAFFGIPPIIWRFLQRTHETEVQG